MTNAIKEVLLQKFSMGCLFLAIASGVLSCANLPVSQLNFGFNVSKINAIKEKRQVDTQVYIEGKVENRAPFVGNAAYQLQDASGSIWVLTKQALPQLGDEIMLKGQVRYQSIKLKGLTQDVGEVYIEEVELLKRTPAAVKGR